MTTNAETFVVKLNFDGQMRRFPVAKGTSFKELRDQVVALLELQRDSDVLLKYADEEGDLITLSSDLELNSALVPGKLLRLTAIERRIAYPSLEKNVISLVDAPMVDASVPTAPPQGADVFRAFAGGCSGGFGATHPFPPHPHPPHHGGPHPHDFGAPGFPPHEGFGPRGHHHRGGFGPRGGHFGRGGPHRGGHFGPRGDFFGHGHPPYAHPRGHMTPEERQQMKKERKEMHKEMKREWKEAHKCMKHQMREGNNRCADGMQWGWAQQAGSPKDKFVARFAKDVTIPDGTQLPPNTPFVKTWRMRNEGAQWPAGCVLRFLGKKSDNMGGPETIPLPEGPVAPNAEVDISVNLMTPDKPGRYTGYWKLCTPEGKKFGQRVWVSIVVPGNSSSSSDSDREADKYEELVDAVLATGLCAKRHRIFRMLQKHKGNVNLVCEKLANKEEKIARKQMRKQMKL